MRDYTSYDFKRESHKKRLLDWLTYLPGAVIISYGIWLSLTVS